MPISRLLRLACGRPVLCAVPLVLVLAACSESPTAQQGPATVRVDRESLDFEALGDTARLTATVLDGSGAALPGVAVAWTVSGAGVVSVSAAGVVTSEGNGQVVVTASAGGVRADVSVRVAQRATDIRFTPDPVTLPEVGDTVRVSAVAVDANGRPLEPAMGVTWESLAPDTVTVSTSGLVEAAAEGAGVIRATIGTLTGSLAVFVGDAVLVIGSVAPAPLVVGDTALIRGLGFSPVAAENEVLLDGVAAQVVSASSVQLRVIVPDGDCRPPGAVSLRVSSRGMADSLQVQARPRVSHTLPVGSGVYVTDGCLHLGAGSGDERYMVGILSRADSAGTLIPVQLGARVGERLPLTTAPARNATASGTSFTLSPARRASDAAGVEGSGAVRPTGASGPRAAPQAPLDRSGEARIREAEAAWLASLGDVSRAPHRAAAGRAAPPREGDRMQLTVPETCVAGDGAQVEAVVRYTGRTAAFLEDTANPAGGFSRDEYRAFDDALTETILPVLGSYFGDFEDVDGNERILVLITKEVNARENLAGFVFSGDLVDLLGPGASCATSNRAEIFYGLAPDTAGVYGPVRTRASLVRQYPPLIAHELTHILQFTAMFTTPDASFRRTSWELEGGATLAEELVGYAVFGHGPRENFGYEVWSLGANPSSGTPDWYNDWVVDLALYFGFKGRDQARAPGAPEECSWIGRESQGNTGPCERTRAVYGVPSMLLRWILDGWAEDEIQDAAMMRRLTRAPDYGLAALEEETGADRTELLVRFAATLWADDRGALGNLHPSWNVADIFSRLGPEPSLLPYEHVGPEPALGVSVRGASNAYLLWTPPSGHEPTSLRVRSPGGSAVVPDDIVLWVLRTR